MSKKLLGIELCRGLAIYTVILDHTGDETWQIPISPSAITFRLLMHFAVPFFLAAAFYFMTAKPVVSSSIFWQSRVKRLLVPYILWSFIFFISRVIVYILSRKPERLKELLDDPLSIVFFGGSSYHLYFLPLLITGTFLILLAELLRKNHAKTQDLIFFTLISVVVYHLIEISGNSFQLGQDIAFNASLINFNIDPNKHQILRLFLVELSWLARCLPYLFIALILNKLPQTIKLFEQKKLTLGLLILFILGNILGTMFISRDIRELVLAYLLLIFGISFSSHFRLNTIASNLVQSVGECSFGIYLIHPFFINIIKPLLNKVSPEITASVSVYSILVMSTLSFIFSWILVAFIMRQKLASKYLFGTFSNSQLSYRNPK
jgi:fucose 4-O-acetylase-like acetyltransferase